MLKNKTVILGVSSSIAAYKACEIVSRLKKLGADVWVVMTESATKLVAPLTFRTLSGNPVITDLFSEELSKLPVPHISLAKKASLMLIAPATANTIAKLVAGKADDPLTTIALAVRGPKLLAPAMNSAMWQNPATKKNIKKLKEHNWQVLGPVEGKLACGDEDIGKMMEPAEIVVEVARWLGGSVALRGKHVLVTAGGTREAIDPVRYISNRSSGKMGYAIAVAAREQGAKVTLISAAKLSDPLDIKVVRVETAEEMLRAVLKVYDEADIVVMAAAVGDFRVKGQGARGKIKKKVEGRKRNAEHRIELEETVDILNIIGNRKNREDKVIIGFALETNNLIKNAKKKLKEKNLDFIVANQPATFDSDQIKFSIIDKNGTVTDYPLQSKEQAANQILALL